MSRYLFYILYKKFKIPTLFLFLKLISGRSSPLVKFPDEENFIRPILKNRDDSRPTTGILKRREKSSSPISATKLRRPSPTFIASKSYSPDHHFYPVEAPDQISRRLPSPLERTGVGFECQEDPSPPNLPSLSPPLAASFERQQNAGRSSPIHRSNQPVSPQQIGGTRPDSPQPRGLRLMSPPLPSRRSSSPPLRGWRHISPPGASSWRRASPSAVPGWRQTSPLGQLSYRLSSPPDSSSWRQSSPSEHSSWRQSSPGQAGWRLSSSTGAMAQLMRGEAELEDMEDEILQIVEQQGNSF